MKSFGSRFPLRWVSYLAYFVGVSFQSGGIVHYSIDPARYGKLIVIGAGIFLVGAVASDLIDTTSILRQSGPLGFIQFIVSSLVLSLGVGMIGRSVQHFLDIPTKAPVLIGLGIVLSAIGFHGRFRPHNTRRELLVGVGLATLLALPIAAGLRSYASDIPVEADHHTEQPNTEPRAPAIPAAAPALAQPSNGETLTSSSTSTGHTSPPTTAQGDGHAHHSHGG